METDAKLNKLRKYTLLMGVFHGVLGAVILALSNNFSSPIRNLFLDYVADTGTLKATTEDIINLPIGQLVAASLFISAIAPFAVASQ